MEVREQPMLKWLWTVFEGPTTSPELRDDKFHFINGGMERDKKKPILCNACLRLLHFTPGMADTCESEFVFGYSFLQIYFCMVSPYVHYFPCSDKLTVGAMEGVLSFSWWWLNVVLIIRF